jgi:glucose uptake protein GlcU
MRRKTLINNMMPSLGNNKFKRGKYSLSFIGLLAGVIASFLWSFLGIIAIIISSIAIIQSMKTNKKEMTSAIIGLGLGIINTIIFVITFVK